MEEVFQRAEKKFSDIEAQIGWLSSFAEKGGNVYEKAAVDVASQLQTSIDLSEKAESAKNFKDLSNFSKEANKLKYGKDDALGAINERLRVLDNEADEIAKEFKQAETIAQREKAEEALRELKPSALGGIKSGEKRRAPAAFRAVFEEAEPLPEPESNLEEIVEEI